MNAPEQSLVAHAYLPPSGAATWRRCAMAPSMWKLYPERGADKDASDEGIAAHWVFAEMLYGRPVAEGLVAPNGVVITDEMIDGAELFVETVRSVYDAAPGSVLYVEQRIAIPSIHELNWGTPDVWIYNSQTLRVHVLDYKFGHGYVDEFENWQLIDYTAGILESIGVDGVADQAIRVDMTVVQPRCYHRDGPVRTWSVVASELRGHFNILRSSAEAVVRTNPVATVNDGCKHCSGRHACEALQRSAYDAAELSLQSLPDDMTPTARGLELRILQRAHARLAARVSGLEESVREDIMRGERVPFFGVEEQPGRRSWSTSPAEIVTLGKMCGVELSKPGVLTPTQALAQFKKSGIDGAVISAYSVVPRGNMKLVADNSKTARKVFQK